MPSGEGSRHWPKFTDDHRDDDGDDDDDDTDDGDYCDEIHKSIQKANRKIPLKW